MSVTVDLRLGDCLEIMGDLPNGCVDACITDPPYGIPNGAAFWRKGGRSIEDWGTAKHNEAPGDWLSMVPFADDAYCLEFHGNHPEATIETIQRHTACGLVPWSFCVLTKKNPPPTPRPKFASGFELCLVSYRGERRWHGGGYVKNSYITLVPEPGVIREHPTQKPVDCMAQWIEGIVPPGGTVLDPFMGSGTTGVACVQTGRNFIGIEIDPEYFAIAERRIAEAQRNYQPQLALV